MLKKKKLGERGKVTTHLYGLIFGVQKSRPARFTLLNARASVLTTVATAWMSASSKAAPIVMGCGKEVACEKSPDALKFTPGLLATPCNASSKRSQQSAVAKGSSALVHGELTPPLVCRKPQSGHPWRGIPSQVEFFIDGQNRDQCFCAFRD